MSILNVPAVSPALTLFLFFLYTALSFLCICLLHCSFLWLLVSWKRSSGPVSGVTLGVTLTDDSLSQGPDFSSETQDIDSLQGNPLQAGGSGAGCLVVVRMSGVATHLEWTGDRDTKPAALLKVTPRPMALSYTSTNTDGA